MAVEKNARLMVYIKHLILWLIDNVFYFISNRSLNMVY